MENFLYYFLIPLIASAIGGIFSVWIFQKGTNLQDNKDKLQRITENYELEEYFIWNIESILIFINHQIDSISEASRNLQDWNQQNYTLAINSELRLTELREIDSKKLFRTVVIDKEGDIKSKSGDFINIKNCFHNIEQFSDSHYKANQKFITDYKIIIDVWNEALENLLSLSNKLAVEGGFRDIEFSKLFQNQIVNEQRSLIKDNLSHNMPEFYNRVLKPLEVYLSKPNINTDENALEVIKNLVICKRVIEQTSALRYHRRYFLLHSGRRLLRIKRLLKISKENIQSREYKNRIKLA